MNLQWITFGLQLIVMVFTIAAAYWKVSNRVNLLEAKVKTMEVNYITNINKKLEDFDKENKLSHASMEKLITFVEKSIIAIEAQLDFLIKAKT